MSIDLNLMSIDLNLMSLAKGHSRAGTGFNAFP
jgi:hypothetical protein